jgi:proline iminopeptidase
MIAAYHAGLTGADEVQRLRLARAWALWEASAMTLQPSEAIREAFGETRRALALASIEAHYFRHDAFLQPDQLLRDAANLEAVPGHIVHGRYDLLCPVEQALALKSVWPAAQLQIVPQAGHAATEPGIRSALVRVMDSLVESS